MGGRLFQWAGSGQEAYPEGRERLGVTLSTSGGPPGGSEVVRRISRRAGSHWDALLESLEWS